MDCPVFHDGLPVYLSPELEADQKRAMHIIFPCFVYDEAVVKTNCSRKSWKTKTASPGICCPHKMLSSIISERHANSIQFSRQTDFEISFIVFNALKVFMT